MENLAESSSDEEFIREMGFSRPLLDRARLKNPRTHKLLSMLDLPVSSVTVSRPSKQNVRVDDDFNNDVTDYYLASYSNQEHLPELQNLENYVSCNPSFSQSCLETLPGCNNVTAEPPFALPHNDLSTNTDNIPEPIPPVLGDCLNPEQDPDKNLILLTSGLDSTPPHYDDGRTADLPNSPPNTTDVDADVAIDIPLQNLSNIINTNNNAINSSNDNTNLIKDKSMPKRSIEKKKRMEGKPYTGYRKEGNKWFQDVEREKRVLKIRCNSNICLKGGLKCKEITEDDRKEIFKQFWDMDWVEKKAYVKSMIDVKLPGRRKKMMIIIQEKQQLKAIIYLLSKVEFVFVGLCF